MRFLVKLPRYDIVHVNMASDSSYYRKSLFERPEEILPLRTKHQKSVSHGQHTPGSPSAPFAQFLFIKFLKTSAMLMDHDLLSYFSEGCVRQRASKNCSTRCGSFGRTILMCICTWQVSACTEILSCRPRSYPECPPPGMPRSRTDVSHIFCFAGCWCAA